MRNGLKWKQLDDGGNVPLFTEETGKDLSVRYSMTGPKHRCIRDGKGPCTSAVVCMRLGCVPLKDSCIEI